MPYRTFVDSTRAEWQVWDIVPRLSERRSAEPTGRRVATRVISFADRRHDERRRVVDARRSVLRGSYAHGWLCFESELEKRRLSPIPLDWTTCEEDRLDLYKRQAERVSRTSRPFTFLGDEPLAEAG